MQKKKKSNQYFTKVHEDAIIEYINSKDPRHRSVIYSETIQPVLAEMIEKIVYTYKFTKLPNVDSLKNDCEIHLVQVLSNFDIEKGYKAFSYFSVITKNWFTQAAKKNARRAKREAFYDNIPKDIEQEFLSIENPYIEDRVREEFLAGLREEFEFWLVDPELKPNEAKVLKAIKILLEDAESITIFNKKAVNIYLREKTGLNTKQLQSNTKKFKRLYAEYKVKWENQE